MDREKIKIIEFDGDGSPVGDAESTRRPTVGKRDDKIKIKEFDFGQEMDVQTVARPENMGPIKIVEFDNDDRGERTAKKIQTSDAAFEIPGESQIRVVEFGDDGERKQPECVKRNGIKIVEYD